MFDSRPAGLTFVAAGDKVMGLKIGHMAEPSFDLLCATKQALSLNASKWFNFPVYCQLRALYT